MKFRHKLKDRLNRSLGLHTRFDLGLPSQIIESLDDYVADADDGSSIQELRSAYTFQCPEPVVDHPDILKHFQAHRAFELPPFKLGKLMNVHVRSKGMYVLPPDRGGVLLESTRSAVKFRARAAQEALDRFTTTQKAGRYFLAFDRWGYNYYYHWMVETLSRFLALDQAPKDARIMMPRKTTPYMLRSLELFGGIAPERFVYFDDQDWQLEECWFATKPYGWFLPSDKEVIEVAKRILANYKRPKTPLGAKRLYISRDKMASRRLVNEEEVSDYLAKQDILTYHPQDNDLDDQIAAFQDAELIVSSFGSAMTNLMFCKPGTRVVILYPETFYDTCNWVLGVAFGCEMVGLSYHPQKPFDIAKFRDILS